jgi:hypothetical protein
MFDRDERQKAKGEKLIVPTLLRGNAFVNVSIQQNATP